MWEWTSSALGRNWRDADGNGAELHATRGIEAVAPADGVTYNFLYVDEPRWGRRAGQ